MQRLEMGMKLRKSKGRRRMSEGRDIFGLNRLPSVSSIDSFVEIPSLEPCEILLSQSSTFCTLSHFPTATQTLSQRATHPRSVNREDFVPANKLRNFRKM